jgi:hypothetical protein
VPFPYEVKCLKEIFYKSLLAITAASALVINFFGLKYPLLLPCMTPALETAATPSFAHPAMALLSLNATLLPPAGRPEHLLKITAASSLVISWSARKV